MKWNLHLTAAQRDVWKASQMQAMLADAGLVISAGKMSNLWSGQPVTIRLADLQTICAVLECTPNDLLVPEQEQARRSVNPSTPIQVASGEGPILLRHLGRTKPPV
jgi:putative transcriptional regulator